MNMNLEPTALALWDSLEKKTQLLNSKRNDDKLVFHGELKNEYIQRFKDYYSSIKNKYMRSEVDALDRHKVVAVFLLSVIENHLITCDAKKGTGLFFVGCEMLATEVGLTWMLEQFNCKLSKCNIPPVSHYIMPEAYACETPYFDIFSRSLFYAQRDGYKLNPIDIAEKLFLLEYITMVTYGISASALKE